MKRLIMAASAAALIGTAACVPMEQAPLVYSSTQTIGVEVSAGEPENPAFDLIIGYGGKDRAFVPVAVAKVCRASSGEHEDCLNRIFENQIIKGRNNVDGGSKQGNGSLQYYDSRLKSLRAQKTSTEERVRSLKNEKDEIERVPGLEQQLESLKEADVTSENPEISKLQGELAYLRSVGAKYNGDELVRKIKEAETKVSTLDSEISKAEFQILELLKQGESFDIDAKEDAYSVYGSFEGNASGRRDGGEIGVGKVFSTGIAAQNITQGISQSAVASAVGSCFEKGLKAAELLNGENKKMAVKQLFFTCRPHLPGNKGSE